MHHWTSYLTTSRGTNAKDIAEESLCVFAVSRPKHLEFSSGAEKGIAGKSYFQAAYACIASMCACPLFVAKRMLMSILYTLRMVLAPPHTLVGFCSMSRLASWEGQTR